MLTILNVPRHALKCQSKDAIEMWQMSCIQVRCFHIDYGHARFHGRENVVIETPDHRYITRPCVAVVVNSHRPVALFSNMKAQMSIEALTQCQS